MIYNKYSYTVPDQKMIRVITNTDAKNEADDQFAIVHTLLSPRFDNRGIIAAHFGSSKSKTSLQDSYDECEVVLKLMNLKSEGLLYKGAAHAIPDMQTPVPSAGAELIIKEAMADDPRPLYVTFLGPLTDMASALLLEPRIADRLTVIWIGGGQYPTGDSEYNLSNDVHAANVVFKSTVALWQVPRDTYRYVMVSLAELEYRVKPCGELGNYLFQQLAEHSHSPTAVRSPYRTGECWCMGDSPVVGLLMYEHPEHYDWVPAPEFAPDLRYIHNRNNRPIRVYKYLDSRFIMEDFYAKLALFVQGQQRTT